MFDIIVLLFLGCLSMVMIYLAYSSKIAFKKAKIFSEMQIAISNENRQLIKSMSNDLKEINTTLKVKLEDSKQNSITCNKYNSGECKLCGGSGECVLERMSTKPQRTVIEK